MAQNYPVQEIGMKTISSAIHSAMGTAVAGKPPMVRR